MKKTFGLLILGAILEYYDFAIFIYFAKDIGNSLISIHNSIANLIASFGVLAIGAVLRPVGGAIFAHFGDTRGRKNVFVVSILLMALPTFLIALIPAAQYLGIYATILLILLRSIQSLAIGGEIPGSIVFAYELSQPQHKALNTNIVLIGTNLGFFTASLLSFWLLEHTWPIASWRLAFMLGGVFGIFSYYLRKNLCETPEFSRYQNFCHTQPQPPLRSLWQRHRQQLWQMLALGSFLGSSLAVFTFFMPTYLATFFHLPLPIILKYNSYSILIFVISACAAGKFDYCLGKKFLITSIPLFSLGCWWLFRHYSYLSLTQIITIHFGILFYIGILCGRLPVLSSSFFPLPVRYTGVALSYNLSFGIIAGLTQMILFSLIEVTGWIWVPAIYIGIFAVLALGFALSVKSQDLDNYNL